MSQIWNAMARPGRVAGASWAVEDAIKANGKVVVDRIAGQIVADAVAAGRKAAGVATGHAVQSAVSMMQARERELVASQRKEVGELREKLVVADAHAAGLAAQLEAIKLLGSNAHQVYQSSDKRFADGEVKTNLHLIYENGFDIFLMRNGVSKPERFRKA